jgi:hypothetical protein
MFGKKNSKYTQIQGRLTNPNDDIFISADTNSLALFSKFQKGSGNLDNKTTMKFKGELSDIRLYYSEQGLIDNNGNLMSNENKSLEDGLICWYENLISSTSGYITDKAGGNNNGQLYNITENTILSDNSIYFDGVNTYIKSLNPLYSVISTGDNFSISLWVMITENVSSTQCILSQVNTTQNNSSVSTQDFKLTIENNNNIKFQIFSSSNTSSIASLTSILKNEWQLITIIYDNSNLYLYINGELDNNVSSSLIVTAEQVFNVGIGTTSEGKFKGYLKDIRIYNKIINNTNISNSYYSITDKNINDITISEINNSTDNIYDDIILPIPDIFLKFQENNASTTSINYGSDSTSLTNTTNGFYKYYKNRRCLYLDGTDDVMSFTHSTQDNFINAVSISMWFNISFGQGTETVYLISKRHYYEFELRYVLNFESETPKFKFMFGGGTNSSSTQTYGFEEWILDYDLNYDEWYHVAVSRNKGSGDKIIYIYINGVKYSMTKTNSINATVTEEGTTTNFLIGRNKGLSLRSNIYVNNLRIYNKELSEKQIKKIYNEENTSITLNSLTNNDINTLKKITAIQNSKINSYINNYLLLNLTGKNTTTTSYVSDYSLNNYNASITDGTLTYSNILATDIGASNVLYFNGSTGLSLDGTKNYGIELKELNYNELCFTAWINISSLAENRHIYSSDVNGNNIYNIYIDTNGRVNVIYNNLNNLVSFNQVLNTSTWYNIIIVYNYGDIKCYIGTTNTQPIEINKYNINQIVLIDGENDTELFSDNLVANYLFNDTTDINYLTDNTTNNLTADMSSFSPSDLSDKGYNFDGTDNLIKLPNNDAFYTKDITISILFKTPRTSKQDIITFNQGIELSYSGYIIRLQNNQITFIIESYKETSYDNNEYGYRLTKIVYNGYTIDTLTHLTLVLNGSGSTFSGKIYKNGQELSTTDTNKTNNVNFEWPTLPNRVNGTIGGANGLGNMFKGDIYDVKFYNRVLSSSEINTLYNDVLNNYNGIISIPTYEPIQPIKIAKGYLKHLDETNYFYGSMDDIKIFTKALTSTEITTNWNSGSINYFSTDNNSTDLIINLDGEPGSTYINDNYSLLDLKLNEGSDNPNLIDYGDYNDGSLERGTWDIDNPISSYNNSIKFDGTDDYVEIPNNSTYNLNGAITISIWIKPEVSNKVIFSKGYSYEFDLRLGTNTESLLNFYNSDGVYFETWSVNYSSYITLNEWNHIIVTRSDGSTSKEVYYYLNGTKVQATNLGNNKTIITSANNIILGGRTPSSLNFQGNIAFFRIYDRVITNDEAFYLYNQGYENLTIVKKTISTVDEGNQITFNGVGNKDLTTNNNHSDKALYLKLNEGEGTIATDYQSKYGNGSLIGCSWVEKNTIYNDNSLYFDGTDDRIVIPNNNNIDLSNAITISCWFKTSDNGSSKNILFSKEHKYEFDVRFRNDLSLTRIQVYIGNGSSFNVFNFDIPNFKYDSWNHLVITRASNNISSTSSVKLYMNGTEIALLSKTNNVTTVSSSTNPIIIGSRYISGVISEIECFEGYISQFIIFTRELSHSEILELYNLSEGWSSMAKYGNFAYDLNDSRKLTITTGTTNSECSGELWINSTRLAHQTILKSNYTNETTRANGDIKLELVPSSIYNKELILSNFDITNGDDIILDYTQNELNDNALIAHYNMEFNKSLVIDKINNNNLTVYNTSTDDIYKDKLLVFDGSDNYCQSRTAISGFNNTSFMISVWVYAKEFNSNQTIFALANDNNLFVNIVVLPSTNGIRFQTKNSSGISNNYNTTGTINLNKWNHLVFIFTNGAKQVYINNVLDSTTSPTGLSVDTFGSINYVTVGRFETSVNSDSIFNGYITDLKIYNNADTEIVNYNYYLKQPINNLIANWNLFSNELTDGQAVDYTGNNTNLQLSGNLTSKSDGLKLNNTIIYFDGTDDYFSNSFSSGSNFYDNYNKNAFTITLWINLSVVGNLLFSLQLDDGDNNTSTSNMIEVGFRDGNSKVTFITGLSGDYLDSSSTFTTNEWYHLSFVFDSTSGRKVYINGREDSSDNYTTTHNKGTSMKLALGVRIINLIADFYGKATDIRYYNKALTQSEIQEIMKQQYKPQLSIKLGGSITSISNNNNLIPMNKWAHLAYNYNQNTNNFELYMNGNKIAQTTELTNTTSINSNFILGNQSFEGQINNYSAYSRNLTANEIKNIYLGLNRLKLQLTGKTQKSDIFTSDVILLNKATNPSNIYMHPYSEGLTIVESDENFINVISFSSSSSFILLDSQSDLWRCRSFTLSMWIKPDSSGSGTEQHIFSRYNSLNTNQCYYIAYDYSNNKLKIGYSNGGDMDIKEIPNIETNTYTHIAVVFENNDVNYYINGKYYSSNNIFGLLDVDINDNFYTVIGNSSSLNNNYKGYIHDLRFYDTSLTEDTITIIYLGYTNNITTNSEVNENQVEISSTDLTTVRSKDFIQPKKSSLILHLNNYTTGTLISSSIDNGLTVSATSMVSSTTEYEFNGTSSMLSITNNDDNLNISGTELTLSMWINADTLAAFTSYDLLEKGSTTDYGLRILSSKQLIFTLGSVYATSNTILTTGEWYHITAYYNGSDMKIYINGEDDNATVSNTPPSNVPNTGSGLYIGTSFPVISNVYFDGKMRDIRIYSSALKINDIKMIYNAGLTSTGVLSVAQNTILDNSSKYIYISKYLIDDNNETADILGEISRDSLLFHYKFSENDLIELSENENTGENESNLAYSLTFQNLSSGNLSDGALLSYYSNIGSTSTATIETGGGVVEVYNNNGVKNIKLNDDGDQNEYIKITNDSNIDLSSDITLSMWIKLDPDVSDYPGHNKIAISKGYQNEFDLRYNTYFNPPTLSFYNNSRGMSVSLGYYLTKGQWYHIAITRQISGSTTVVNFYVDGTNIGNRSTITTVSQTNNDIYIGARNSSGTNTSELSAEYKNIKIYTKVLTDNEMTTLYNTDLLDFTGRKNKDSSILSIPSKMTSLRPNYLSPTRLIKYTSIDGKISSSSLISTGTGYINSDSLLFDGNTSSYIIIDNSNIMVNNWSYSVWYKLLSYTENNIFLSRKETNKNLDILMNSTNNEIQLKYNNTTISSNYFIDINDNEWQHLTITYGQKGLEQNIISFYHNGELVSEKVVNLDLTTSLSQLIIGSDTISGFNGYMDDLRMYTCKLNNIEVNRLYNNNTNIGPLHYWLMEDDTTGRTVIDVGSAGNNLVLNGSGTSWDTNSDNIKYGTRSIKFDGTTSNFASSSSIGVLGNQPRAISIWFKRSTSNNELFDQELLSFGNPSVSGQQFSAIINTSSNIQINLGNNSNITGTTPIIDTNWHQLIALQLPNEYYTDDRALKLFIDGSECTDDNSYTQTEINTTVSSSVDLLNIGKGFKGYINEVKIYNYSLTNPEIDLLYANKNQYMLNLE